MSNDVCHQKHLREIVGEPVLFQIHGRILCAEFQEAMELRGCGSGSAIFSLNGARPNAQLPLKNGGQRERESLCRFIGSIIVDTRRRTIKRIGKIYWSLARRA